MKCLYAYLTYRETTTGEGRANGEEECVLSTDAHSGNRRGSTKAAPASVRAARRMMGPEGRVVRSRCSPGRPDHRCHVHRYSRWRDSPHWYAWARRRTPPQGHLIKSNELKWSPVTHLRGGVISASRPICHLQPETIAAPNAQRRAAAAGGVGLLKMPIKAAAMKRRRLASRRSARSN